MKTMTYQRKNNNPNTVINLNSDNRPETTSSYSFSNYAKAGLAIVGTVAGATALANKTGYLSSSSRSSDAATDNTLDNSDQLISPQETIMFTDNPFLIQPRHAKRAFGGEFQVNTYTTSRQWDPSIAALNSGDFIVVWGSDGQDGDCRGIYGQRYSSTGIPQDSEFQVNTYTTSCQDNPSVAALSSGDFVVIWMSDWQDGSALGIYGQRFSSTGVPQGSEFQVNTYTTSWQGFPSVAVLSSGDFVVIWMSDWQDGNEYGIYGQCYSSTGIPQDSEFQVNTYTTSWQKFPSVAALSSGGFVVIWMSNGQDGDEYGIYGQRYSSTGIPQDSEFQINTYIFSYQRYPSVTALSTGGFVVVWESYGQDGDEYGIYGQRYSSTGIPQDSEFQINTYTTGWQNYPSVAGLSTGDFMVVWQSFGQDGDSRGIYGQRFSNTAIPQGGEFQVNTYTTSWQESPSVAALSTGDFMVVWESYGQDGDGEGIYGQRYSSTGIPQDSEFQVNTYTTSWQWYPTVAALSTGDFMVVWDSLGQDGDNRGIYGQRFSSTRVPQGAEFQINTYTTSIQYSSSVAALSTGDFMVVWESYGQDGSDLGIYGQRFSSTGVPQGSEFQVNTYTTSGQEFPSVAALSSGDFVVIWESWGQDGSGYGIYGQRYSSTGVPQGSEFQINTYTLGSQDSPSAAALSSGDFVVVWKSFGKDGDEGGIYGQRFSSTGVPQGSEFQVNTYTTSWQQFPSVAALSSGDFVVIWESWGQDGDWVGIYGQRFNSTGSPKGGEFQINTYTTLDQSSPSVAALTSGGFVVTWESFGQDSYSIYGQRYSSTGLPQDSEFKINTYSAKSQSSPSVAALSLGDFVVVWHSEGQDGDGSGIYGRMFFPPRLISTSLIINEGATVILSSLNLRATDTDNYDGNLYFTVSNVQYGQFERISNTGVAITSFLQQDIIDGNIQFVHDGSENPPTYDASVSDGSFTDGPVSVNITFSNNVNDAPLLENNALLINKGAAVILNTLDLSATDSDNNPSELTFSASNVQQGQFERVSNAGVSITSFTQQEIIDAGIQFVHDNSILLPAYSVNITDGAATSAPEAATIIVISQNQLVIQPGEVLVFGPKQLAIQTQLSPTDLEIRIAEMQFGHFEKNEGSWKIINLFDLSELNARNIRFVHDGSENKPEYILQFSDLSTNYMLARRLIGNNTILNHAPIVPNPISVLSKKINEEFFYVIPNNTFTDPDDQPLQVSVKPLNSTTFPAWVQFDNLTTTLHGTPVTVGIYAFKAIATDPYDATVEDRFYIDVQSTSGTPTITANALTLLEDQTVVLTSSNLAADDTDNDNNVLLFTVSNVQNGQFENVTNPGVSITTFTQLEIANSSIQFVHDGNENTPYYEVSVSDGTTASTNDAATITFININDAPVLNNYNILITSPGQSMTIDGNYLSATDSDSDDDILTFTISNTKNCRFELITSPGMPITLFRQQQVKNGNIQFVHTQVANLPIFQISVSDGSLSTTSVDAMTFQIINNQLVVEPGQTVPITADNINVLTQRPATDTMISVTNVANGYFMQTTNPGQSINNFSLQQIKDGDIAFVKDNKDNMPSYDVRLSYTNSSQITPAAKPDITLNHPPIAATKIQNQQANKAAPFDFTLSENTFSDPDGDPLTVSAEMQDGSTKPAWLQFELNYNTNRHRFFGTSQNAGVFSIRVVARDTYNASANSDFLLQASETTSAAPIVAAIAGGAALLGACLAAGIVYFKKAQDRKTRKQHKFAQLIRHHLKLQKIDNFKSEDGQRFVQAVQSLSSELLEKQGIDIANIDNNRLEELAGNIATSAKNKITPDTTKFWKKSEITISEFEENIKIIAQGANRRPANLDYNAVDDASIPMQLMLNGVSGERTTSSENSEEESTNCSTAEASHSIELGGCKKVTRHLHNDADISIPMHTP